MNPNDFAQRLADKLVAQLKEGTAPWQKPWTEGLSFRALRCPLWIAYWVGLATYSATLRLFKVESGINGLLPTLGPLHLFRFSLEQASLRAGKVTAFCVR